MTFIQRTSCSALILCLGFTATLSAAPIEVTGGCTLGDAIETAQLGYSIGGCSWGGEPQVKIFKGIDYVLDENIVVGSDLKIYGDASAVSPAHIQWQGPSGRMFDVVPGGRLELTNFKLTGGAARSASALKVQAGGEARIFGVTFSSNGSVPKGGAIFNAGVLDIEQSTFDGNTAHYKGGAIHNRGNGTVDILYSVFVGNSAAYGAISQKGGPITIRTSTFSANQAYRGAALYVDDGEITVDFSTFRNNEADFGSAIFLEQGSQLTLGRSALTAPSSTDDLCHGGTYVVSADGNVFSDMSCGWAPGDDVVGAEIAMSELVHHGGLTQVHVPLCDWTSGRCESPLIDREDLALCDQPLMDRDQRDQFARIDPYNPSAANGGEFCDVGAYESVCEGSSVDGEHVSVLLREYQVRDGKPMILDNGDCFGHPLWEEGSESGCEIRWSIYGGRLEIVDIVFLDPACEETCFPDTAACEAECTGSGPEDDVFLPSGWVEQADSNGAYRVDVADCNLPALGENESLGYLIGVRDVLDPLAEIEYWDPKTPITNTDLPNPDINTGGGGG